MGEQITRHCYFRADYARAAAIYMAKLDVRYYLQGVHVEPHPEKGVIIAATNGHQLIVIHDEDGYTNGDWICQFSPALLSASKKCGDGCDRDDQNQVVFFGNTAMAVSKIYGDLMGTGGEIRKGTLHAEYSEHIDGKYPDIARVIPKDLKAATASSVNAVYLAAVAQVQKALNRKFQEIKLIQQTEHDPLILLLVGQPITVVLMPLRSDGTRTLPAYLDSFIASRGEEEGKVAA